MPVHQPVGLQTDYNLTMVSFEKSRMLIHNVPGFPVSLFHRLQE